MILWRCCHGCGCCPTQADGIYRYGLEKGVDDMCDRLISVFTDLQCTAMVSLVNNMREDLKRKPFSVDSLFSSA